MQYIAMAIPIFLLLILVEYLFARHERKEYYRFNDAINDLSCGVTEQVLGVFAKTMIFGAYIFLYKQFAVLEISSSSATGWIVLFLGVDFCYYWFHRASHRSNAVWAAHIVHHQSEEYNLAVALRQGAFQSWFSWAFYLPLALAGFPPLMFLTASAFNTLYQFWIHTRTICKLGPLEWVLNTPSHHRVHHGRNPQYIDKNYAGVFIVWDRMFGTFEEEREEVVYGVTEAVQSWNPIWANFHYWAKLLKDAAHLPRWWDRLKLFVMPPGWRPDRMGAPTSHAKVTPETVVKYDVRVPNGLNLYVGLHFAPVIFGTFQILRLTGQWPDSQLVTLAMVLLLTVLSLGGILDRKAWALRLESVRLLALPVLAAIVFSAFSYGTSLVVAAVLVSLLSATWLYRFRQIFLEPQENVQQNV